MQRRILAGFVLAAVTAAARTAATGVSKSGEAMAGFLPGLPSTFTPAASVPQRHILTTFDSWIQDDFRVSKDLTLNPGMRWERRCFRRTTCCRLPGGRQSVVAQKGGQITYADDPRLLQVALKLRF